jgi:hypothetical protein
VGDSRNELRFSQSRVSFFFCPYMEFLHVSQHQMCDGSRQFCKANDIEISLVYKPAVWGTFALHR